MRRLIFAVAMMLFASSCYAQMLTMGAGTPKTSSGGATCGTTPIQILGPSASTVSGAAAAVTSTVDAPAGSTVVVAIDIATVNNQAFVGVADTPTNSYTLVQPAAAAGTTNAAIGYSVNTTHDLPIGSQWTVTTGGGNYYIKGAWITCTAGVLDKSVTINQATPGTSASLSSGTLSIANETAFGYVYMLGSGSGGGTLTTGSGFTDLQNDSYTDVGYLIQSGSTTSITYAPSWTSSSAYSGVLVTFETSAGCSQATTFLARTSGLSGTERGAYTTLICGLVTDGTWSLMDTLYVTATNTTTTAYLNLISTSYPLTSHGTCTFTADSGITGDGSTCYLDSGYNTSTNGVNYTTNSASFGACDLTSRTTGAGNVEIVGFGDASIFNYILPLDTGPNVNWGINDGTGGSISGASNPLGSWIAVRASSTGSTLYKNGSSLATYTVASTGLANANIFFLAYNNVGTAVHFLSDKLGYGFAGASFSSTQAANVRSRLSTYLSTVGAPSGC